MNQKLTMEQPIIYYKYKELPTLMHDGLVQSLRTQQLLMWMLLGSLFSL